MNIYHLDDIPDDLKRFFQPAPQLGLEKTPQEYVAKMVEVFREVRRVLRDDGTLWLNLGDSYAGSMNGSNDYRDKESSISRNNEKYKGQKPGRPAGLKAKDLCGIPWRLAFALQADGWWLRQDIIWHKPAPMPESVTDRCTKSHEYIFLLTKSAKYFYDAVAIQEEAAYDGRKDEMMKGSQKYENGYVPNQSAQTIAARGHARWNKNEEGLRVRNKRSVWSMNSQPYMGAHFATFPEELPLTCIKAGTSEKGRCPDCGAPWERIMDKGMTERDGKTKTAYDKKKSTAGRLAQLRQAARERGEEYQNNAKTMGWRATCKCGDLGGAVPCLVLDPFSGAGTTCMVAKKLNRRYIGIELNPEYVVMAERRIETKCGTLF